MSKQKLIVVSRAHKDLPIGLPGLRSMSVAPPKTMQLIIYISCVVTQERCG